MKTIQGLALAIISALGIGQAFAQGVSSPMALMPSVLDPADMSGASVPSGPCAGHQSFIGRDRSHWRCDPAGQWFMMLGANLPYVLPPASSTVRGGIKVGSNLILTDDVLSAPDPAAAYVLPPASPTTRGGVTVGANLTMTGDQISAPAPYTDAQALAAAKAGLGSAAQQPASAFLAAGKIFSATTTTAADGSFTATFSPACTAAPTVVQLTARIAAAGLANMVSAALVSATASSVTGQASRPATLAAFGLTVVPPPTGTTIMVMGVCP